MILLLLLTWKLDKYGVWTITDSNVNVRDLMCFEDGTLKMSISNEMHLRLFFYVFRWR